MRWRFRFLLVMLLCAGFAAIDGARSTTGAQGISSALAATPAGRSQPSTPPGPQAQFGLADRPASPLNIGQAHLTPNRSIATGQPSVSFAPSSTANMTYHNGPVEHSSTTFAIFWLPTGFHFEQTAGNDSQFENLITTYFQKVGSTPLYNMLSQYPDGTNGAPLNSSTFGGSILYTATYPHAGTTADPLLDADFQGAVEAVKALRGWTGSATNEFFVYTGYNVFSCHSAALQSCNFTTTSFDGYCAYHSAYNSPTTSSVGYTLYANMGNDWTPDPTGPFTCLATDVDGMPAPNGDDGADSSINTTSHEHFETVTDPVFLCADQSCTSKVSGWYDSDTSGEISDKCNFLFGTVAANGSNVTMNGASFIVQQQWSNAAFTGVAFSGCVLGLSASGTPTGVTAIAGNGGATVTWNAPVGNGGSPITGYTVTGSPGGSTVVSGTTLVATVPGLTNGTAYMFTVHATNAVGNSAESAQSNGATPQAEVPGAPTDVRVGAGNAQATVTWTAPASDGASAITGYTVTPLIGSVAQTPVIFSATATTQTITGLTNGMTYTFTVKARNGVGTGLPSSASNAVIPTASMLLSGTVSGIGSFTVAASVGGVPCQGASVVTTGSFSGLSLGSNCGTAGQAVTLQVNGGPAGLMLSGGVTCLAFAPGTARSGLTVTPGGTPDTSCGTATAPGAPADVRAGAGNAQATVTWTAPASNGGSAITGYTVTPFIGSAAQTPVVFSGTQTTQTITGLTNGMTYTFTVKARNSVGTGLPSTASNAVTP